MSNVAIGFKYCEKGCQVYHNKVGFVTQQEARNTWANHNSTKIKTN